MRLFFVRLFFENALSMLKHTKKYVIIMKLQLLFKDAVKFQLSFTSTHTKKKLKPQASTRWFKNALFFDMPVTQGKLINGEI